MKQLLIIFLIVFIIGCSGNNGTTISESVLVDVPMEASEEEGIMMTEDGLKYIVHPDKILSGGPPMDGIPSIDNPQFVSVTDADEWIEDNELVLAIIHKGVKRVYPLQILVWHEIVNDNIVGDPVLITYCPYVVQELRLNELLVGKTLSLVQAENCIILIWLCTTVKRKRTGHKLTEKLLWES